MPHSSRKTSFVLFGSLAMAGCGITPSTTGTTTGVQFHGSLHGLS